MSQNQPQIIKDETLNQQLLELGYIVIPFLNPDAVLELKSLFHALNIRKRKLSSCLFLRCTQMRPKWRQ
ncbi:MAG: hypothetical protein EBS86_04460 [Crocinitomicaceae bacterium]|nr:hypothetical protein [Crocinitomicaceae bacterium]